MIMYPRVAKHHYIRLTLTHVLINRLYLAISNIDSTDNINILLGSDLSRSDFSFRFGNFLID